MGRFTNAILLLIFILLSACDTGFLAQISRYSVDPQPETPVVASFKSIEGIPITWDSDSNADSYIVYRQKLTGGSKVKVYAGVKNSFFDTSSDVLPQVIYAYTVSKMRGNKEFRESVPAYGAYDSQNVMDPSGDNNQKSVAREFTTYQMSDHLFYFADAAIVSTRDEDWYFATVPANKTLTIKLLMDAPHQDGKSYINVNVPEGSGDFSFPHNGAITLTNGGAVERRIYFCCYPNPDVNITGTKFSIGYSLNFGSLDIAKP